MLDLLRRERFGALYYLRRDSTFYAIPPPLAPLLVEARERSILDAYVARTHPAGPDEESFVRLVARWKRLGLVDHTYRCQARLVDGARDLAGLIAPMVAHVMLTRACNLRCAHCFTEVGGRAAPGELSAPELHDLFGQLGVLGTPIVVLSGGEPLLRPDLEEILRGLAPAGLDAWLCTNGTLIDHAAAELLAAAPLRGVNVSLDGADAQTHDRLRGAGSFERARRGAELLVAAGVAEVKLRVTVTADNIDSLLAFAPLARELGVHKVVFKPFLGVGNARDAVRLALERERYVRAIEEVGERWPTDAPEAELSDGVPTGLPAWTGVSPRFGCVAGYSKLAVSAVGRVVGCDGLIEDADWSCRDRTLEECWRAAPGVARWRQLEASARCAGCARLSSCGGGCRLRGLAAGGDLCAPDPWAGCPGEDAGVQRRPVVVAEAGECVEALVRLDTVA